MRATLKCRECQFQIAGNLDQGENELVAIASLDKHYRDHHPGQQTKYITTKPSSDTTMNVDDRWDKATKTGIDSIHALIAIQRQWTEWGKRCHDGFPNVTAVVNRELTEDMQDFLFRLDALDLHGALSILTAGRPLSYPPRNIWE